MIILIILVASNNLTSLSYSQNRSIQKPAVNTMMAKSKVNSIKIIFLKQGQSIHNDKSFTIAGISAYDHHTNCRVSIVLNNVRPYQNVIATGHNGSNDYSTWKFSLSSKYTIVKSGLNRVAAKLTCSAKPTNITRFYGVNFYGQLTSKPVSQLQLYISKNNTNSASFNKSNTALLTMTGKKEPNKPSTRMSSTSQIQNKIPNNKQTIHTTIQPKIIYENKSSINPESSEISSMNRTNGPLVLTLPSVKDNLSSASTPLSSASTPLLPGMPSENHSNNNVRGSNHNSN